MTKINFYFNPVSERERRAVDRLQQTLVMELPHHLSMDGYLSFTYNDWVNTPHIDVIEFLVPYVPDEESLIVFNTLQLYKGHHLVTSYFTIDELNEEEQPDVNRFEEFLESNCGFLIHEIFGRRRYINQEPGPIAIEICKALDRFYEYACDPIDIDMILQKITINKL